MPYYADSMTNKIGHTVVVINDKGAVAGLYVAPLNCPDDARKFAERNFAGVEWNKSKCSDAMKQVHEYYLGKRKKFDLKLELNTTSFRKKVWTELMNIPYGETATYGDIAKRIGQPKASRAIGQANHNNPIMIIVP